MKWFFAGLGLIVVSLLGGLAAIVAGYRQVIGRYIAGQPDRRSMLPRSCTRTKKSGPRRSRF